jgi:hypothetical protein
VTLIRNRLRSLRIVRRFTYSGDGRKCGRCCSRGIRGRRWCDAACFARIVKIIHFFDGCTTLTRDGWRRSCTFGQNWYRTSTHWPESEKRKWKIRVDERLGEPKTFCHGSTEIREKNRIAWSGVSGFASKPPRLARINGARSGTPSRGDSKLRLIYSGKRRWRFLVAIAGLSRFDSLSFRASGLPCHFLGHEGQ